MPEPSPSRRSANLAQPTPPCLPGFTPVPPCPTVVLRHTLPDGNAHYDWLFATDAEAREPLITFRMEQRVDDLPITDSCAAVSALSISHHRAAYLTYEGPVSGNRGEVSRVRSGVIRRWAIESTSLWRLTIEWEAASGRDAGEQGILLRAADSDMMHWEVVAAKPA